MNNLRIMSFDFFEGLDDNVPEKFDKKEVEKRKVLRRRRDKSKGQRERSMRGSGQL